MRPGRSVVAAAAHAVAAGAGAERRRMMLGGLGAALAAPALWRSARAAAGPVRVLVVGAGWSGLSALQVLRREAPDLEVTLVDRERVFRALPLSTPWLLGFTPERLPRVDLEDHARNLGVRFVAAQVRHIDRTRRVLDSSAGALPYDWLLLATGAMEVAGAETGWFGGDVQAAAELRRRFPAGFQASELDRLQQGLQAFAQRAAARSGAAAELVLSVPPAPYRCPPAPYERALLLAQWIRAQRLRAHITLLDAGGGMPRFTRLFQERWHDLIDVRPYSEPRRVDPWAQTVSSDDGELHFDHALLLAPMGAGPLPAQAGLTGTDAAGQPGRWAAVDPHTLRSAADERIYIAGDALDRVSILFGSYPKTAQIAADLGAAAARRVIAASRGKTPPPAADSLPGSQCHVWLGADPPEQLRIETQYRLRGDGVLVQTVRQIDNPQPRDEDLHWARALLSQRLGIG